MDILPGPRSRAFACCAGLLVLAGCLGTPHVAPPVSGLNREVLRNTFIEDGRLVTMAVNTDAARRRSGSDYVPLGLMIANNGNHALTADRENLVLTDDQGHRYPLATVKEIRALGSRTTNDYRASEFFATYFSQRLEDRPRVRSRFFPNRGRGLVEDRIQLPGGAWIIDVVYFPRPPGELLGRTYELTFSPRELEDPIFVRFNIE